VQLPSQVAAVFMSEQIMHKPGPGSGDLCLPPGTTGEALRNQVHRWVHHEAFAPPTPVDLLFALYHELGLPRAWQLAALEDLEQLAGADKAILKTVADAALSQMKDGEKYFFVWAPFPTVQPDTFDDLDLRNEESVERDHWAWTMPKAFLERLSRLSQ
jgi:hypothetical protein